HASSTGFCSTTTKVAASSNPAAKLASYADKLVDGGFAPPAMLQYPAAALCTELWKSVGDTARCGCASAVHSRCRMLVSASDVANTVASSEGLKLDVRIASSAMRNASRTAGAARRRSFGGRRFG